MGFIPWVSGHCFVADRCVQEITRYYTIYTYIYDVPGVMHPDPPANRTVLTYADCELQLIGFNWGWGNDDLEDDNLFAPEGAWEAKDGVTYRYSKHMTYDFN